MEKYVEILKKSPLFDGIETENLLSLLGCLDVSIKAFAKNQTILYEGDPAGQLGIVLSGSVRVSVEDYFGNRNIFASVGPAGMFAEAFCFAGIREMPVGITSADRCEVMLIDSMKIVSPCARTCTFHARLIFNLLRIVSEKNLYLNKKTTILSKRTTREKLLAYFLDKTKESKSNVITLDYNRQELADYLGVERSAMCSVLGQLKKEGIIDFDRNRFKILKHTL